MRLPVPFGLVQELFAKILLPRKKLRLPKFSKYLKYIILFVFVGVMPVAITNIVGMGNPASASISALPAR